MFLFSAILFFFFKKKVFNNLYLASWKFFFCSQFYFLYCVPVSSVIWVLIRQINESLKRTIGVNLAWFCIIFGYIIDFISRNKSYLKVFFKWLKYWDNFLYILCKMFHRMMDRTSSDGFQERSFGICNKQFLVFEFYDFNIRFFLNKFFNWLSTCELFWPNSYFLLNDHYKKAFNSPLKLDNFFHDG